MFVRIHELLLVGPHGILEPGLLLTGTKPAWLEGL